jgi:hypothetical protein
MSRRYPYREKGFPIWNDITGDLTDNEYKIVNVEPLVSFDVITPVLNTRKAKSILQSHGCKILNEQFRYSSETIQCECEENNRKFLVTIVDRNISTE